MKHWLPILAVLIYTAGESTGTVPTTFAIDDQNYVDVIISKKTCLEDKVAGMPPAVVFSSAPVTRMSIDGVDCYHDDGLYPNGTPINQVWVRCQ